MRVAHFAVPLALLLWQIAPAGAPPRAAPPRASFFRLGLAYATGDWEQASFDCNGKYVSSVLVPANSGGARLDYASAGGALRVTAVGGRWSSRGNSGYYMPALHQTFGGGLIALEGRGIGIGAGLWIHPYDDTNSTIQPSAYLRLGRNDRAHFEAEVFPMTETPTMMGTVRMGLGFGQTPAAAPRMSGFIGVAWGPFTDKFGQGVVVADLGIPLSRSVDLLIRGSAGPGAGEAQWAAGGGLRASLGH